MFFVDARNKERKKEEEDGEMGRFLKHQKTMKMFVYVYNTMLLVLGISNKDFTVLFKLLQAFYDGFWRTL